MTPKLRGRDSLSPKQDLIAEQIIHCVAEWITLLHLERWELVFTFNPSFKEGESDKDARVTWAETHTSWCYQTIHMTLFARALDPAKINAEDIEHMVVHELSHSLVSPMVPVVDSEKPEEATDREQEREEFVVTNIERILVGLKHRNI